MLSVLSVEVQSLLSILSLVLTITLSCAFIPQIYSLGFKTGTVNISVTDLVLLFNFFFLFITFQIKRIYFMVKQYPKILFVFLLLSGLVLIYLLFSSYYNDFGLVLKLARTLLYSFFIYLLFVISYKEKNVTNYLILLSIIVSIATIFTYRSWVITTGEYVIFRNSETFLSSILCYLIIWLIFTRTMILNKIFGLLAIVSLISAIIVEQDRVQIIAVLVSISVTILFLLLKKALTFKRLIKIIFSIIFIFGAIFLLVIMLKNDAINKMFQNYYNYRIAVLFNNSGNFQMDSSLSFRKLEYQNIISIVSQNFLSILFGKGLGATYLGTLTVVDSFWFWIILNMGLVGLLFFAYFFYFPSKILIKDKTPMKSAPIFAYFCATFVMTLTIPNMIYRVDDSVSMGIFFGLLHLILINNSEKVEGSLKYT